MATIATHGTAPSPLQLTDDALQDLSQFLQAWFGWGVSRKLDRAVCGLPRLHLLGDLDHNMQQLQTKNY